MEEENHVSFASDTSKAESKTPSSATASKAEDMRLTKKSLIPALPRRFDLRSVLFTITIISYLPFLSTKL